MKPEDKFKKYLKDGNAILHRMYKTREYINTVRDDLTIDQYIEISEFIDENANLILRTFKMRTSLKQKVLKQITDDLDKIDKKLIKKIDLDIIDYYYFRTRKSRTRKSRTRKL